MTRIRLGLYLGVAFIVLLSANGSFADSLDDFIRDSMIKNHVPGVVIEMVQPGKPGLLRAYGLANVELHVASRVEDVYPLASVTKVFTSTAVLLLVQDGKLQLEQPIGGLLSGLPSTWRSLTVRQCLSHSTGLPDIFEDDSPVPIAWELEDLLAKLKERPLSYPPGTKSRYEQTDYILLRLVVEHVTGRTLPDFISERILVPLGMNSARWGDSREVVPDRVSFYWRYPPAADRMRIIRPNGKAVPSPDKIWANPFFWASYDMGAVGLNMNASDLVKFDGVLWTGKLLRRDLLEEMVKPISLPDGKRAAFSLAWEMGDPAGDRLVYYDGAGAVIYAHDLDTNTTIIVFTNCNGGNPWVILRELLGRFCPNAKP
jgi:D-alanyl-D-alanine carboxypeptidase